MAQTIAYGPFAATVATYCAVLGILKNVATHVAPPSKESSGVRVAVQTPETVTPAPAWPVSATCAAPFSAVIDCEEGAVSGVETARLPETLSCASAARTEKCAVRSAVAGFTIY